MYVRALHMTILSITTLFILGIMEQHTLKIVNNRLNTNIYSYLETSGGQSYNLYLNVVHFFNTSVLIKHLWQLMTVVFLHWCLICALPLDQWVRVLLIELYHSLDGANNHKYKLLCFLKTNILAKRERH